MAEKIKFVCEEPATLLFSSITQASAPRGVANAEPKFSGTFGITKHDLDRAIPVMVHCIQSETGAFSGNPNDYYLAIMGGNTAAARVMQKAEYDAQVLRGRGENDKAFQVLEKATKRADAYKTFAGIMTASSKFEVELAKLVNGAIVDIVGEGPRAQAGKDMFYPGAIVVPSIALQGFRRKKIDDRDGVTGFLQNVLYLRKGPKIDLGGGHASNSEVFGGFKNYSNFDPLANAPGGSDAWNTGAGQGQQAGNPDMTAGATAGAGMATHAGASQAAGGDAWGSGQPQNTGYQPQGGQARPVDPNPQW